MPNRVRRSGSGQHHGWWRYLGDHGNQGDDTISLTAAGPSATVDGGQGADQIRSAVAAAGNAAFIYGNLGGDVINVSGANPTIYGGQGNDTIAGGTASTQAAAAALGSRNHRHHRAVDCCRLNHCGGKIWACVDEEISRFGQKLYKSAYIDRMKPGLFQA